MNCTLTRATSAELNTCSAHTGWSLDTPPANNMYATAPMAAVLPPYQPVSEEELHTSFEKAISQRTSALHERLSHYSHPALSAQDAQSVDDHILHVHSTHSNPGIRQESGSFPLSRWQFSVVLIGLAVIFTLIGFDLMGLLILHMH